VKRGACPDPHEAFLRGEGLTYGVGGRLTWGWLELSAEGGRSSALLVRESLISRESWSSERIEGTGAGEEDQRAGRERTVEPGESWAFQLEKVEDRGAAQRLIRTLAWGRGEASLDTYSGVLHIAGGRVEGFRLLQGGGWPSVSREGGKSGNVRLMLGSSSFFDVLVRRRF